ncbi:MAG: glycerophosphodiester phosphodiesterase [Vicinamibacteria bacterium]
MITRKLATVIALAVVSSSPSAFAADSQPAAKFDLQAHRGGRGLWPENTLAAFEEAMKLGVTTLELDCAVTKDGVVVISHDALLSPDITRDATGEYITVHGPSFFSMSYADTQRYDVGRLKAGTPYAEGQPDQKAVDGQRIPRLIDVFNLVKKSGNTEVRFNIETKVSPAKPDETLPPKEFTEAVVKVIREAKMEKRSVVQSFDFRTLDVVHKMAPEIETSALTSPRPGGDKDDSEGSVLKRVKASGALTWSPNHINLTKAQVDEAHRLGLVVLPWTINEPADLDRIIGWGVDGIITDRPDRLRDALRKAGRPLPNPTRPRT